MKPTIRILTVAGGLLAGASAGLAQPSGAAAPAARPNILFIMLAVRGSLRVLLALTVAVPTVSLRAAESGPAPVAARQPGELRLSVPGHRVYLFESTAKFDLNVNYRSAGDRAAGIVVTLEESDFFGSSTTVGARPVSVPAAASVDVSFAIDAQSRNRGIRTFIARANDAAGRLLDRTTLAVGIIPGPNTERAAPGGFLYGVCSHAGRREVDPAHPYWQWLSRLGVDHARFDFSWDRIQPADGPFRFETYDALVNQHLAIGVAPVPLLAYFARWFAPDGRTAPADLAPFYTFVESTVARYKDRLRAWEIWNEADWRFWPNPFERYTELYRESYRRIKALDPTLQVMNSGWAFLRARQSMEKAAAFHKAVGPDLDIIAFHAHGDLAELKRKQTMLTEIVESCGLQQKAIWDNESGWSSHGNRSEREQAETLVKKIVHAQSAGWGAYFWYDMVNDGTARNENEHNFGLVRSNLAEPKSAYLAYHALIRLLRGATFRQLLRLGDAVSGYCFENERETICALWLDEPGEKLVYLDLGAAISPEIVDLMGNASRVASAGGRIAATASTTPCYIRWRRPPGSAAVRPVPDVIGLPPPPWLNIEEKNTVMARLTNPFDRPLEARVAAVAGGDVCIVPAVAAITLEPGATNDQPLVATLARPGTGRQTLRVTPTEGEAVIGRGEPPISWVLSVPNRTGFVSP